MATKNKTTITLKSVSVARATLNILSVLSWMLENDEGVDNSAWYASEGAELSKVAETKGFSAVVYLAAIAAFSPSIRWDKNKSEIARLGDMVAGGATLEDVKAARFMGYPANVAKAYRILSERDTSILRGQKVVRFWRNLCGLEDEVTIDRHACNIARNGLNATVSGEQTPTAAMYLVLSVAYSNAAKIASVLYNRHFSPSTVQAITWGFVSASVSNHAKE